MAEERNQRRLAAILAADVVGYSKLMGLDESGTLSAFKVHRHELVDAKIAEHQGRIVKLTGDGLLVCAADIQHKMRERNADVPADRRIEFRIGINLGDIIIEDDDIFGDGVNIAARIESIARPGGVAVSGSVRDSRGEARFHLEKAVQNNPNDTEARGYYAYFLHTIGQPEATIEQFELSKRQNPYDFTWFPWGKGWAYFTARRYGDAIASLKSIPEPINEVRGILAASYAYAGRLAEAKAMLEEFLRVAEDDMAAFLGRRLKDWDEFWRGAAWYQHQEDHDHLMDGLRKAGLPE